MIQRRRKTRLVISCLTALPVIGPLAEVFSEPQYRRYWTAFAFLMRRMKTSTARIAKIRFKISEQSVGGAWEPRELELSALLRSARPCPSKLIQLTFGQ